MSIRDSIQTATKLLATVHDAELKSQLQEALLNAQNDALDLQDRVAKLQEDNASLRSELDKLNELLQKRDQVFLARNAYWRKGETLLIAYCPNCYSTKQQLIPLNREPSDSGFCQICKSRRQCVFAGERPQEGDEATPRREAPKVLPGGKRRRIW